MLAYDSRHTPGRQVTKVGLYTSHLVDFRERIRINGECISEQYVIDFRGTRARDSSEPCILFELTTALAFKYFAEQRVDIAIDRD